MSHRTDACQVVTDLCGSSITPAVKTIMGVFIVCNIFSSSMIHILSGITPVREGEVTEQGTSALRALQTYGQSGQKQTTSVCAEVEGLGTFELHYRVALGFGTHTLFGRQKELRGHRTASSCCVARLVFGHTLNLTKYGLLAVLPLLTHCASTLTRWNFAST